MGTVHIAQILMNALKRSVFVPYTQLVQTHVVRIRADVTRVSMEPVSCVGTWMNVI